MKADLSRKATLKGMRRLGAGSEGAESEGLERAGREPTTSPEEFEDREGYIRDFLSGWKIDLPMPLKDKPAADDMRPLRRGGKGVELKYTNFSVVMSASRRMPMVTAANIDGSEARSVPRISVWSFDGRLDEEDQWGDALYDNNDLDRGHMVRREDPIWGTKAQAKQANEDTFHFTNSCPQMAGVNQKVWLGLENYVLQHAKADDMRVSVFTGPFFTERDLDYRSAKVPLAFWKVVAIVTDDGRPSATAYKVSQARELEELEFVYAAYKTFQVSIRQIIKATGIDFTPLVAYDGFSEHELASNTELVERLDDLEHVRV